MSIWAVAGHQNPTDDDLARLWHACRRHRVAVLRMEMGGPLAAAVWDSARLLTYDPSAAPRSSGRCWAVERWGPTMAQVLRGEPGKGIQAKAGCGVLSRGVPSVVIYWPGTPVETLSGAREMGAQTRKVGALLTVPR